MPEETSPKRDAPAPADKNSPGKDEPDEAPELKVLQAKELRLLKNKRGALCLMLKDERGYPDVKPSRAFPLTIPNDYVEFRDSGGKAIGLLVEVGKLGTDDKVLLDEALTRRYFSPQITRVVRYKESFGLHIFEVETDRGPRTFSVRNLNSDVRLLGDGRYRIKDTDGTTYDILDLGSLDAASQAILDGVL